MSCGQKMMGGGNCMPKYGGGRGFAPQTIAQQQAAAAALKKKQDDDAKAFFNSEKAKCQRTKAEGRELGVTCRNTYGVVPNAPAAASGAASGAVGGRRKGSRKASRKSRKARKSKSRKGRKGSRKH